ncbi:uncharacterized protein MELLADRAFT_106882 [Melampsora larici-populina 98AG31]|uniref:Secreted protein n=1 Tax=Melampsora larici-populina (strain 98AG31 / pathotype 3-4-7) TaxID=747676 RepID=F4RMY6_MELLP|nr:uncharacterized protein MELLADRAFT_106882 [Melampsora larici-populina 98AG31]EGG06199.1 hypothetical protein MELLADRAFT_106882 [Melampsora larici-populina 98AG31]
MANQMVELLMILLISALLHGTLAVQDNPLVVEHGLTGQPGFFDLNSLPEPEIEHELVNTNQVIQQTELETTRHQSSAPVVAEHGIISRPHIPYDFQDQGIPSKSTVEIDDKLYTSRKRKLRINYEFKIQMATEAIWHKISKLFPCIPANERDDFLRISMKDLLYPYFDLGSPGRVEAEKIQSERVVDEDNGTDIRFRLRSFQDVIPVPLLAAASISYAEKMLGDMSKWLRFDTAHNYVSWSGIWNRRTILPFVYFIMLCNPSYYMWERIEKITIRVWKAYYVEYIHGKPDYDIEVFSRFLLWHTEVMSHVARSSDLTEPPAESLVENLDASHSRASPITRIIRVLLRTTEYETYTSEASRNPRNQHLNRYLEKGWKEDEKKNYPTGKHESNSKSSLWGHWNAKSDQIERNTPNFHWPQIPNDLIETSKNLPVLLVREESILYQHVQGSSLSDFVTYHSKDFLDMMKHIHNPKRPELRSKFTEQDMYHALTYHLNFPDQYLPKESIPKETQTRYSLDLVSEFLDQDPESPKFRSFWSYFHLYKWNRSVNTTRKRKSMALRKSEYQTRVARIKSQDKSMPNKRIDLRKE